MSSIDATVVERRSAMMVDFMTWKKQISLSQNPFSGARMKASWDAQSNQPQSNKRYKKNNSNNHKGGHQNNNSGDLHTYLELWQHQLFDGGPTQKPKSHQALPLDHTHGCGLFAGKKESKINWARMLKAGHLLEICMTVKKTSWCRQ
jgi:hypothetical protein